jgi:hypothetical protein
VHTYVSLSSRSSTTYPFVCRFKIINSLKILQRTDVELDKFDREKWSTLLTPVLNLWKKLNQVNRLVPLCVDDGVLTSIDIFVRIKDTDFIKAKIQLPTDDNSLSPIQSFLQLERFNGIQLIQKIHENLAALSKVIRGINLITNEIQEFAKEILQNEVRDARVWCDTSNCRHMFTCISKYRRMTIENVLMTFLLTCSPAESRHVVNRSSSRNDPIEISR